MNEKYTHITLLVDRSGSMNRIKADMEGGIKGYLSRLSPSTSTDKCLVSMYEFDDRYEVVCENTKVQMVGNYVLEPRGWTQLLDAVGKTIVRMGEQFNALPEAERPGKVILLIVTDGKENRSTVYNKDQIRAMIKEQTDKYKWEFVFVGAGLSDFSDAHSVGINSASMSYYDNTPVGVADLWRDASKGSNAYRQMSGAQHDQHMTSRKGFFQTVKQ